MLRDVLHDVHEHRQALLVVEHRIDGLLQPSCAHLQQVGVGLRLALHLPEGTLIERVGAAVHKRADGFANDRLERLSREASKRPATPEHASVRINERNRRAHRVGRRSLLPRGAPQRLLDVAVGIHIADDHEKADALKNQKSAETAMGNAP
jgi:hypothetical protein